MTVGQVLEQVVLTGHAPRVLAGMDAGSAQMGVTSPPYYHQRNYGTEPQTWGDPNDPWVGELGWEPTVELYIAHLVDVFREMKRVIKPNGTLWVQIGDTFAGSRNGANDYRPAGSSISKRAIADTDRNVPVVKYARQPDGLADKNLLLIPWRFALAMQADGWILRSAIAGRKLGTESVRDRPTRSWDPVFLFAQSKRYKYNVDAAREPAEKRDGTRNQRDIWYIQPEPNRAKHPAKFSADLPRRAILLGSDPGDVVLDPFVGSGSTLLAAGRTARRGIGIELKPAYAAISLERLENDRRPMLEAAELAAMMQGKLDEVLPG